VVIYHWVTEGECHVEPGWTLEELARSAASSTRRGAADAVS
jgi:hypothetical protein